MEEKNMREMNMEEMDKVSGGTTTKEEYIKFHEQLEKEREQERKKGRIYAPDRPAPVDPTVRKI